MSRSGSKKNRESTAFLYERLSRDDNLEGDSYSVANQKKLLTKVAKELGYTNLVHFFDDGISGVTMNRPDYIRMIEDFENNFMVITAIENTSMVGLTLDKIDTDGKGLYISLIHYEDGVEYDENETCISIKISRDLEKENIYVTRNLRDNEKDMSEEMQLAEKNTAIENLPSFQYKDEYYRKAEKSSNSALRLIPPDWKDMISKNFTITKNMPEIDFSNWNDLGNDFYSIAITDYSEYLKLMNNYNAPKLTWFDFKYIYAIIVVRVNADNTIDIKDIESENGKSYLNVSIGGWLDVSEEFKYPAVCVAVPNYRSLESNFLNVRVK